MGGIGFMDASYQAPPRTAGPRSAAILGNWLTQMEMAAKRVCDVLIAGASLLFPAPMMILIGAMIMGTQGAGNISAKSQRLNGKQFVIYKFRTFERP